VRRGQELPGGVFVRDSFMVYKYLVNICGIYVACHKTPKMWKKICIQFLPYDESPTYCHRPSLYEWFRKKRIE
jgi:hypothetical protein